MVCEGVTQSGKKCLYKGKFFTKEGKSFCSHHISSFSFEDLSEKEPITAKLEEIYFKSVENRLFSNYTKLSIFRDVPPPEDICATLLNALQNGICYMCWALGYSTRKGEYLIEDHCHKTGMVRALLCRSCNVKEGKNFELPWNAYREYSPANSWCYRYFGRGQQWFGELGDPIKNRISLSDLELPKDFHRLKPQEVLNIYLNFAEQHRKKYKPKITEILFDFKGHPYFPS
jgi:hypothetical protein